MSRAFPLHYQIIILQPFGILWCSASQYIHTAAYAHDYTVFNYTVINVFHVAFTFYFLFVHYTYLAHTPIVTYCINAVNTRDTVCHVVMRGQILCSRAHRAWISLPKAIVKLFLGFLPIWDSNLRSSDPTIYVIF